MIDETNNRGNTVTYGESPHIIDLTADPQILLAEETLIFARENNYLSDNRTEGSTLVFQE